MRHVLAFVSLIAIAAPAAAQHESHGQQAAAPPAAAPQAVTPPEKMNDSIPPGTDAFVAAALAASPRHGEWIDIRASDGTNIKSWVVYPETHSKAGVVIVVHENRGLNDWVRAVADQAAEDGFIAIAPDMLSGKGPGGGNTDSIPADQIGKAFSELRRDEINDRLDAVREYAMVIPAANGRVGMVGFCWGGGTVFNYVVHQPALNAAVIYYGPAPQDPMLLDRISTPLLGLFGADDERVNATVTAALPILNKDRKQLTAQMFPGAGHAFMRQQFSREGNLRAAEKAWPMTIRFFGEYLK
jgi:carboxymethylenebutenolidase